MAKKSKAGRPKAKSGPKPGTLKIKGDWKQAIKRALAKKKPKEGWPK
ncbi:MAG: hypothetical protein ACRD2B_16335 [Terriglobia bacterium]